MSDEILYQLRRHPHLLGHALGKDKLSQIHSDWILYIWDTTESRSLQAHRGSYKTTAITIIGSIWWLLFHPNDRICIMRKSFSDAAEIIKSVANLMQREEAQLIFEYAHGILPRLEINRESRLKFNFKTSSTPEGSLDGYGVESGITGKHYDRILTDDIVTRKDRWSRADRERTKDTVREIRTNILDPGQPLSSIGTPWHKDDAWSILPEPKKFSIKDCNILSAEEVERKRKETTPSLFSINYLLEHRVEEDLLFSNPGTVANWDFSQKGDVVAHLDAAFSGDHTNGLTIMQDLPRDLIQAVGFTYPGNVKEWLSQVKIFCDRYRVKRVYVETNPDKGWTADMLRSIGLNVSTYAESLKKETKISTVLYQYWHNILWVQDTEEEYMGQLTEWREGQEPDDCPDSAASLLYRWKKQSAPSWDGLTKL